MRERHTADVQTITSTISYEADIPDVVNEHLVIVDRRNSSDVVTPNFHRRIADGEIINNPCRFTGSAVSIGSGSIAWTPPEAANVYFSGATCLNKRSKYGVDFLQELSESDYRTAKLRALASLDSTPFAFGEDMLEIRETLRFLRNPVKSLYDLSNAVKRKSARGVGLSVADAYLGYRFAFSPLVRTAYSAARASVTKDRTESVRLTARGFSSNSLSADDTVLGGSAYQFYRSSSHENRIKASILYSVSNPAYSTRWKLGLRTKDIPYTMWQVMPYSFMIDRLVDVSSMISGFVNLLDPSVRILAASCSRRATHNSRVALSVQPGVSDLSASGNDAIASETYERSIWNPTAHDVVPPFRVDNLVSSATKIGDLLALTIANLGRR